MSIRHLSIRQLQETSYGRHSEQCLSDSKPSIKTHRCDYPTCTVTSAAVTGTRTPTVTTATAADVTAAILLGLVDPQTISKCFRKFSLNSQWAHWCSTAPPHSALHPTLLTDRELTLFTLLPPSPKEPDWEEN